MKKHTEFPQIDPCLSSLFQVKVQLITWWRTQWGRSKSSGWVLNPPEAASRTSNRFKNVLLTLLWISPPQVLKERRENRVTTLELSSTFLPQANRNKLLQYILGFTLLWPGRLSLRLRPPQAPSSKGLLMVTSKNNPRCYSVESFTRKCLHATARW